MLREITSDQAITEAIGEEMKRDSTIFLMGEDLHGNPTFGGRPLDASLRKRVLNTPISEPSFVGAGLGAALTGMRPIVKIMFADFSLMTLDQIGNQIAKITYMSGGKATVPLVIWAPEGASGRSAAQHSQSVEGLFLSIPGLKVITPSTPYDVKGLFKTAIRDDNPVIFLTHKRLSYLKGPVPEEEYLISFGQGEVKRKGEDVTIVSWLYTLNKSLTAAEQLEEEGITVEVVDPRTLVPLDKKIILDSVQKTGRLVVAEEECKRGSVASEIAAIVAEEGFQYLKAPIKRIASKNVPIPYAKTMEDFVLPQVEDIVQAVKEII
ncbi:MAG: alpha-ketoacid dehydrogenase subunit beta [Candidatus Hermodarchaeia archaeon]|jgi:pyruvate dehydrogenase E1 component beta subunit